VFTLKEQQKRINEQKEMISKQAHLVAQRIQEEQHLKSSLKEKDKEIDDASFVVFVALKLLADLLDFQEFVFYWVCQVFLVYFRMVIQIVYGLLVLRRLDCLCTSY
jgi:DNA-binding transcriptional regulator GbsR (MarR family)